MHSFRFRIFAIAAILLICGGNAEAQESISLDTYTCSQFLNDAAAPGNASKLLRSMMMIAWATGYAAAHQHGAVRADARALQLIGASIGDVCRKMPTRKAVNAISNTINELAQKK